MRVRHHKSVNTHKKKKFVAQLPATKSNRSKSYRFELLFWAFGVRVCECVPIHVIRGTYMKVKRNLGHTFSETLANNKREKLFLIESFMVCRRFSASCFLFHLFPSPSCHPRIIRRPNRLTLWPLGHDALGPKHKNELEHFCWTPKDAYQFRIFVWTQEHHIHCQQSAANA